MINLAVISPGPTDATSFYRAAGPFELLRVQLRNQLRIKEPAQVSWNKFAGTDVLFMQRPFNNTHVGTAEMAFESSVPIWVDYDDNLFDVPTDNPTHQQYSDKKNQENIAKICKHAAIVTVTTEALRKRMEHLNSNIQIIPNGLDDTVNIKCFKPKDATRFVDERHIVWRGSPTHMRDLMVMQEAILEAHAKHPEWIWHFIGYNPWFITDKMAADKCVVVPGMDIRMYFGYIRWLKAEIQMVPLADNEFNKSKSNIAWIEGSWAGSASLVPAWPEWLKPGTVGYKSPDGFFKGLDYMMMNCEELPKMAAASWAEVEANYSTAKLNEQRAIILRKLLQIGGRRSRRDDWSKDFDLMQGYANHN